MIDTGKIKEMSKRVDQGLKEIEVLNQLEDEALREHMLDCYREYRKEYGLKMLLELNEALGGDAVDIYGEINEVVESIIKRVFNPELMEEIFKKSKED